MISKYKFKYKGLRKTVNRLDFRFMNRSKYRYEFRDDFRREDWIAYFKNHKYQRNALFNCMNKQLMHSIQLLERNTPDGIKYFNLIIIIRGKTGDGKSVGGDSIAIKIRDYWDASISNVYTMENVIEKIKVGQPHDTIIRDESKRYNGDGSQITEDALKNVTDMMRFKGLNLILIAPRTLVWEIANLYLDACGFDLINKINRFLVWNPKFGYQGYITIFKHEDEEFEKRVDLQKDDEWEKLLKNDGLAQVSNLPKQEHIDEVINYIKENKKYIKYKKEIRLIIDKLKIACDRYKKDNLILMVWEKLQEDAKQNVKKGIEKSIIKKKNHYVKKDIEYEVIEPASVYEDSSFFRRICRNLKYQKQVEQKKAEVFRRYLNGEKFERMAIEFDRSGRTLNNWFDDVVQEVTGYIGEDCYAEFLEVNRIKFIHGGENSDEPDFYLIDENKYVSFKTQYKLHERNAKSRIGYKELRYSLENGSKLVLLVYSLQDKNFREWVVKPRFRTPKQITTTGKEVLN